MKYDVAALGELLIDLTENGTSEQGNPLFEANPGGAPANVLAMLSKLGRNCAFIGKVGKDNYGNILADTLSEAGIDIQGLRRDEIIPTTLAIVHLSPGGERDFSFYRKPGADIMLAPEELDHAIIGKCRIFHFGSLSLTEEPSKTATMAAIKEAKEAGALISFDPNLRPPLWRNDEQAKAEISWGLSQCDILKIADNELVFMTGEKDIRRGSEMLRAQYPNIRLMNVTLGADGAIAYYGDIVEAMPGITPGVTVDTTGAGDTYCGCVLNYVLEHGLDDLTPDDLKEMMRFANAAAYLVTTKRGAIKSMPDIEQIKKLL
jgi:fructokinase